MIEIIFPSGEYLDVSPDMSFSMERGNPFLTNNGAATLSFEVPLTDNNKRLIGSWGMSGLADVPPSKHRVVLKLDGLELGSILIVEGINDTSYVVSLVYGESLLYSQIVGVTLPEIFSKISVGEGFSDSYTLERFDSDIISRKEIVRMSALSVEYYNSNCNDYYKLLQVPIFEPETYTVDGGEITALPMYRYGVHLKLNYVLKEIFKYFGFRLNLSKFPLLQDDHIILLNNVMDLCVIGKLEYKYMVPTCEVSEFLEAMRKTFLIDFFYDYSSDSFHVYPYDEVGNHCVDVSERLGSEPYLTYSENKPIAIIQEHTQMPDNRSEYIQMQNYEPGGKNVETISIGVHGLCVPLEEGIAPRLSILPSVRWVYTEISYELQNDSSSSGSSSGSGGGSGEEEGGSTGGGASGGGSGEEEGGSTGGGASGGGSGFGDVYICGGCSAPYIPSNGDPSQNIVPGTEFKDLPSDWHCPVCGAWKEQFIKQYSLYSEVVEPVSEGTIVESIEASDKVGDMPIMLVYALSYTPIPFTVYKAGPSVGALYDTHNYHEVSPDYADFPILSPYNPIIKTEGKVMKSDIFKWNNYKNILDVYSLWRNRQVQSVTATVKLNFELWEFMFTPLWSSIMFKSQKYQIISLKCKKTHDGIYDVVAELKSLFKYNL